jgi:hypothetical protein
MTNGAFRQAVKKSADETPPAKALLVHQTANDIRLHRQANRQRGVRYML